MQRLVGTIGRTKRRSGVVVGTALVALGLIGGLAVVEPLSSTIEVVQLVDGFNAAMDGNRIKDAERCALLCCVLHPQNPVSHQMRRICEMQRKLLKGEPIPPMSEPIRCYFGRNKPAIDLGGVYRTSTVK